jgi:hypothetical protein
MNEKSSDLYDTLASINENGIKTMDNVIDENSVAPVVTFAFLDGNLSPLTHTPSLTHF